MKLSINIVGAENSIRSEQASLVLQFLVHVRSRLQDTGIPLSQDVPAILHGSAAALFNLARALISSSGDRVRCMFHIAVIMTFGVSLFLS